MVTQNPYSQVSLYLLALAWVLAAVPSFIPFMFKNMGYHLYYEEAICGWLVSYRNKLPCFLGHIFSTLILTVVSITPSPLVRLMTYRS